MSRPENLTVDEFCAEHKVARSTFYAWRATGKGPRYFKLPNGQLRIRRSEIDRWVDSLKGAAS